MLSVDFEAARLGLRGLPRSELPSIRKTIKTGWVYAIPIVVLLYLLIGMDFAPQKAALWSVIALLVVAAFRKETRVGLKGLMLGSEDTIRGMLMVAIATASAGIIVAIVNITGLGASLAGGLLDITGGNIWFLLLLGAVVCYIMGMGMSHVAMYMILAIMIAPAMISAGIPVLATHLFIVWWCVTAFITPPIGGCLFAAAAVSGGSIIRTGFNAMRIAVPTYLLPFAFCTGPALLLVGTPVEIVIAVISAIIGVAAIAAGLSGWILTKTGWLERILLVAGSVLLIFPGWTGDAVGVGLIAVAIFINLRTFLAARAKKISTASDSSN